MKEKWIWVEAEHRPKGKAMEWYKYTTNLMLGETIEDAIDRIKKQNPTQEFRNFKIKTED